MIKRALMILPWLLTVACMATIFAFSSQNGVESSSASSQVTEEIAGVVVPDFESMPREEQEAVTAGMEHTVRKLAHGGLFCLLGISLLLSATTLPLSHRRRIIISAAVSLLYAISDELHQSFSPGRSPQAGDVLIDFAGALVGIAAAFAAVSIVNRLRERRAAKP